MWRNIAARRRQYSPRANRPGTIAPSETSTGGLCEPPARTSNTKTTAITAISAIVTGECLLNSSSPFDPAGDSAHQELCRTGKNLLEPQIDVSQQRKDDARPAARNGARDGAGDALGRNREHQA